MPEKFPFLSSWARQIELSGGRKKKKFHGWEGMEGTEGSNGRS